MKQIALSEKQNKVLSVQWPLTKEILDHRYAKDLIAARSQKAVLDRDWDSEGAKSHYVQKQLASIVDALKPATAEVHGAKLALKTYKGDWHDTNVKLVEEHKELDL